MNNPRISRAAPEYRKVTRCSLVFALMLCSFAATSFAQNPSMSWGEQLLSITTQECMRRAPLAFRAEGFNPESPSVNTTFATKGNLHSAYLRCIGEEDKGRARVIIVVASSARDDNVPGAERVRLQGRMDRPDTSDSQNPNLAGDWESYNNGSWKPTIIRQEGNKLWFTNEFGSTSAGFFESSTRVKASDWQGGLGATIQDANTIKWGNESVWRRRAGGNTRTGNPNLAGDWESYSNGAWKPTGIRQDGNRLWFTNEHNMTSEGYFESPARVKASQWQGGLGATVEGNMIKWDNSSVWRRR